MRKSWITLGVLLASVAALGLFAWLKPPQPEGVAYSVSAIKPAEARMLRVQRRGVTVAALEKRNGEWAVSEPMRAPADAFQVLRLLAILEAKSPLQYPASDLSKFELDVPQTEIIINDQRFAFGAINNVTREQYVLTQNRVYPLEPRFGGAVPAHASALLRRSVLAPGDKPERFEFSTFTVAADAKKWTTTPLAGDLSQDDYQNWVAQWREGSALRVEAADQRKPLGEIHIVLNNDNKVSATVTLDVVQTEPELIVRRADLGLQFVFVGDVGRKMMSPPAARK